MPRTPLEAYAFDARFGKRSVFTLDPRLTFYLVISDLWSADSSVSFVSFTKITPHIVFSRMKPSLTSCMMFVTGKRRVEVERGALVYCCQYAGRMSYTRTFYP